MCKGPETGEKNKDKASVAASVGWASEVKLGWRCRDTEARLGRPQSIGGFELYEFYYKCIGSCNRLREGPDPPLDSG